MILSLWLHVIWCASSLENPFVVPVNLLTRGPVIQNTQDWTTRRLINSKCFKCCNICICALAPSRLMNNGDRCNRIDSAKYSQKSTQKTKNKHIQLGKHALGTNTVLENSAGQRCCLPEFKPPPKKGRFWKFRSARGGGLFQNILSWFWQFSLPRQVCSYHKQSWILLGWILKMCTLAWNFSWLQSNGGREVPLPFFRKKTGLNITRALSHPVWCARCCVSVQVWVNTNTTCATQLVYCQI